MSYKPHDITHKADRKRPNYAGGKPRLHAFV